MNTVKQNPDDFPKDLPLLFEPPKGKKWSYRGMGWDNGGKMCEFAYWNTRNSSWVTDTQIPCGFKTSHYAELVDAEPDYFSREYQAELAKQWVLEGGFEREVWVESKNNWRKVHIAYTWDPEVIYRRKQALQPTQEELDARKVKEISDKTFKNFTDWNHVEKAILEAIKYGRETKQVLLLNNNE